MENLEKYLTTIINEPETVTALIELLSVLTESKKQAAIEMALTSVFEEPLRMEAARLIGKREAYLELRNLFDKARKVAK